MLQWLNYVSKWIPVITTKCSFGISQCFNLFSLPRFWISLENFRHPQYNKTFKALGPIHTERRRWRLRMGMGMGPIPRVNASVNADADADGTHVFVVGAGSVCPGECLPGVSGRHPPVDRMTDTCKALPCPNYVADGNKKTCFLIRLNFSGK